MLSLPRPPLRYAAIFLAGLAALSANAQPRSVSSQASPEREFRLFVGVDLKVRHESDMVSVADYNNGAIQLDAGSGQEVSLIRLDSVRFIHNTKIGRAPATIGSVDIERFRDRSAEAIEWMRRQGAIQTYQQDRLDAAEQEIRDTENSASGLQQQPDGSVINFGDPSGDAAAAFADMSVQTSQLSDPSFYNRGASDEQDDKPDSLRVKVPLSSPAPIRDAYVVGIARIRDVEGSVSDVVFFQNVALIDRDQRVIEIIETGLPEDYEMLDLKLHLYREGHELPTNVSEKQFALNRQEMLQYLSLEQTSRNRGKTLPASPVWSLAPPELLEAENPQAFDYDLQIEVSEAGAVTKVHESNQIVPANIASIAEKLFFHPALESGVAVPSTTQINLSTFFR